MKILFLTYDLPFPLDQGGKIRAYYLLKNLSSRHQITLFSFIRKKEQKKYLSELQPFCQKIVLFQRIKAFSFSHFFFSLSPQLCFPVALYWSAKLKKRLKEEVARNDYDLIHFESFYTSLYLDKKLKIPQILGTENIEWQIYRNYALHQKNFLLKYPMILENLRIRQFERKTWRMADVCLAVSRENAQIIERVIQKKVPIIENGIDLDFFQYRPSLKRKIKTLLFVGNFAYIQNQDAVWFLVKKIFPLIKKEVPFLRLLIVGRNPSLKIKNYAQIEGIEIKANLSDIRKAYSAADILVAPIRAGSGTKFKILEAMAAGLPVVTTTVGIEGIQAKNGTDVIVEDNPEKFAQAVIELLKNKRLFQKLSLHGRELVVKKYNWSKIVKKLESVYQRLINEKKS